MWRSAETFSKLTEKLFSVFEIDSERVDELRVILEREQNRKYTHEEAERIGTQLTELFELLAGDRKIILKREMGERDSE